jgi:hypothetical protein
MFGSFLGVLLVVVVLFLVVAVVARMTLGE